MSKEKEITRVANNFFEWMVDNGYCDRYTYDETDTIKEIEEDLTNIYSVAPRLFNQIKIMSDR